jgi:hypothetical protein
MASTYTPSGIEIIGNGEQSATWGDTTNENLQIIDRMISQAGTISLSGTTHTLTISDGTLSDGQYGVLVFGGSPSGTNTVTIDPNDAKRIFIVKNGSGQSVVLTQGSGGNVTIADGGVATVYCDGAGAGAAVVDVSVSFTTLGITATAADINQLADNTFDSNVTVSVTKPTVLIEATGTGSADQPALRFKSNNSINVHTIAFADAASDNAGVISYTHLTDSMKFFTDVTERMIIDSSGDIGIGTSTPAEKLHVSNNISAENLYVTSGGDTSANGISGAFVDLDASSKSLAIEADPNNVGASTSMQLKVDGVARLAIDSNGYVGIGTLTPATTLHVNGTATITTATITTANITTANVTTVDLGDWTVTESAGVLYFATGGTNKMKLDASGNLTVTGNVTAYGTI